jgi:hypothetical protein
VPAAAPHVARAEAFVAPRPWVLLIPVALVVAAIVALSGDGAVTLASALSRIDDGDAAAVLAAVDKKPPRERTGEEHLARGHALVALDRLDDAMEAYRSAVEKGFGDARALDVVLGRLDRDEPDRALDILVAWPDASVKDRLVVLTKHESWNVRHHAVTALEEREEAFAIDLEAVAMLDLAKGPECRDRRQGLALLKRAGQSQKALDAIKAAREARDNGCLVPDLESAYAAVQKRVK